MVTNYLNINAFCNEDLPVWSEVRAANINGKQVTSLAITLKTKPCRFQESTGSCKFCELRQNASPTITRDNLVNQVQNTLITYEGNIPEHLDLFGLGTFFDNTEIPSYSRKRILEIIGHSGIKSLLVESRAEYININRLRETIETLSTVSLEVAIGIESTNLEIRETLLNKRYREGSIERAVSLLGETNVGFLGYVLLKPPSIFDDNEEKEAIEDTVNSSLDIFNLGRRYSTQTRVGLNPFYLPDKNQFSEKELENYSPPSLWSVVEVIRRVHEAGTVFVGLNNEGLTNNLKREVYGCDNCTEDFKREIRDYCGTRDLQKLLSFYCECKNKFMEKMK